MNHIETYLLCGNQAHDLESLDEGKDELRIWITPCGELDSKEEGKGFLFRKYERKYLELLLAPDEELEPYLPFIGGDSNRDRENGKEFFCLNFSDFEIGFWAEWPEKTEVEPSCGINFVRSAYSVDTP
ncbi:MAG: hypothetical protein AAGJ81_01780 [Verrucomicrobiota bacterium]